ncbi:hypothetical protein NDU88_006336 [Pleurodeles waltl]|uniref:Uncharacterized protein n=1 Tax=Pleurodeles waltl TaxID=8319 RepID=A0AAV7MYZ7_PLEWA|nr:hypothetical protein NDU88_006336 [Pleurodeles waltl]
MLSGRTAQLCRATTPLHWGALRPDLQVGECWILLLAQSPVCPLITADFTSAAASGSVPLSPSAIPAGAPRSCPLSPGCRRTPVSSADAATRLLSPLPAGTPNGHCTAALTSPAAGPCDTQLFSKHCSASLINAAGTGVGQVGVWVRSESSLKHSSIDTRPCGVIQVVRGELHSYRGEVHSCNHVSQASSVGSAGRYLLTKRAPPTVSLYVSLPIGNSLLCTPSILMVNARPGPRAPERRYTDGEGHRSHLRPRCLAPSFTTIWRPTRPQLRSTLCCAAEGLPCK